MELRTSRQSSAVVAGIPIWIEERNKIAKAYEKALLALQVHTHSQALTAIRDLDEDVGISTGQLDRVLRHSSMFSEYVITLLQRITTLQQRSDRPGALRVVTRGMQDEPEEVLIIRRLKAFIDKLQDPTPSDDIERLSEAVLDDANTQYDTRRVREKFLDCDPKLQNRIGVLNRLRRLRLQDFQRSFEKRVASAIQFEQEKHQQLGSGSAQSPRVLPDTQIPLNELLHSYGSDGDRSEASSISSDDSSGYQSFKTRDQNLVTVQGAVEPQVPIERDVILKLPEIPSYLKFPTKDDTRCPFCLCTLQNGLTLDQWK